MGDVLKNLRIRSQKRKKLLAQTVRSEIKWKISYSNLKHQCCLPVVNIST